MLQRLATLPPQQLDVQAYHLFQNVMVATNAAADPPKLRLGSWASEKDSSELSGAEYCAGSAMPWLPPDAEVEDLDAALATALGD